MKVIIPAAGLGSRLRPHTYTTPKPLLRIAGKPIIGHILDQVISWGGDKVVIIVGHLREQLEDYIDQEFDLDVEFREQEEQLGLGHAILTGLDPDDKEVLVILGDTILDTDLNPVIAHGVTSIGVKEVPDPRKLGVVLVEDGRVKRLIEKPPDPPSNLAIVGVYYIRDGAMLARAVNDIMDRGVTVKGEFQVTDALQVMIDWDEPVETFPVDGWYDCGNPATLLRTNRFLFDKLGSKMDSPEVIDSIVIEPVSIDKGVKLIRSTVGPYVAIGEDTLVEDSIIKDSLIGDRCQIERVIISDTIMGDKAHLRGDFGKYNIGASSRIGGESRRDTGDDIIHS